MPYDKGPRDGRWYLSLMAPNTRGKRYPWLDPTSAYINDRAFRDLQDDLCAEIDAADVDVVAGLDAMGFILGAGIATRLDRGFAAQLPDLLYAEARQRRRTPFHDFRQPVLLNRFRLPALLQEPQGLAGTGSRIPQHQGVTGPDHRGGQIETINIPVFGLNQEGTPGAGISSEKCR